MPLPVHFTVYSDFLCPWCYVGAHRLRVLQDEYGDDLVVEWRSFLLRPEPRVVEVAKFERYTQRWNAPGAPGDQEPALTFTPWSGGQRPPTSSLPSAMAGKLAARLGAFGEYQMAGMRAYFTEQRDIADPTVLAAIAGEVGLDAEAFGHALRADAPTLRQQVLDEYTTAIDDGIHAVPTVVVNDVFPLPGAQDTEAYRRIIERHRNRP